jgi:hypothetical protein
MNIMENETNISKLELEDNNFNESYHNKDIKTFPKE